MDKHLNIYSGPSFREARLTHKTVHELRVGPQGTLVVDRDGNLRPNSVFGHTYFVDPNGSVGANGLSKGNAISTMTAAVGLTSSNRNDVIFAQMGQYDENLTVSKSGVTIQGTGGRGAAYLQPSTAGAEGVQVTANDVTFLNFGIAGDDTGDYALNLHAASRFRAVACKIELGSGAGSGVLVDGTTSGQTADALFEDCEFCWSAKVFTFDDSTYGYPTQINVERSKFHNITTNMFGIASGGLVKDLHVYDCRFGNAEDGTAPTDYILLSSNSNTGDFAGNYFATATNATGVLTIGTGIKWGPNGTEAGWSTARPA